MRRVVPSVLAVVALALLAGAQLALGSSGPPRPHRGARPAVRHTLVPAGPKAKPVNGVLTGSIAQTDRMWVCKGPVNLDSVLVTMTAKAIGARKDEDAVHLGAGCTGRIDSLTVVQWAGDGVKAAEGVHDLIIGGGSIRCYGKAPNLHQDGVQVMGGSRIAFSYMAIDCGRSNDRLIDSNFFVKRAGQSASPPSDIVCDHCTFGGWTAHTVNIQSSLRSGVSNSRVCKGRFPKLTVSIGADAVSPVNNGNTVAVC